MTRSRLAPELRREHILDAARGLFAERPYTSVTTADIAQEAGVARSLVHHYFGGIREVFLAVVATGGALISDVRTAGTETPFDERIAHNVAAALDVVEANREVWLAVAGHGDFIADPQIRGIANAAIARNVERTLELNPDMIDDTPAARRALHAFNAFSTAATRSWLIGDATRAETEALLTAAGRDLIRHTIPSLQRGEGSTSSS